MQRTPSSTKLPVALALFVLVALVAACERSSPSASSTGGATSAGPKSAAAKPPVGPPLRLVLAYGSEKKTWLEEQLKAFRAGSPRTAKGRAIEVEATAMGSGEAVQAVTTGGLRPHVFSPASSLYLGLLNDAWAKRSQRAVTLAPKGEPLVLSPVIIAMWKPMAEALGWPAKALGWADLLKIHADPKGWGSVGHPDWGRFKLGHAHPELSNSGLQAIVAEAYAGAKKRRGLTLADVESKAVRDTFASIEETVAHYGKSTGLFADKMLERGPAYLSAAVIYENLVIESYAPKAAVPAAGAQPPLVAIYPKEGTFWSDHPYAVLDAEWVGADEREAAEALLTFLREKPLQQRALAMGFRPADPAIPITAPVDAEHGVDPKEPQALLEPPSAEVLERLLQLWRTHKKASDVILVLDKSGSMAGRPLAEAKLGARAFLGTLHERDEVTLLLFDGNVYPPFGPKRLSDEKAALLARIEGMIADGQTSLYDATARAYAMALERRAKAPNRIHAVVVMTDGKDEGSSLSLQRLLQSFSAESEVKVFTIAYGGGADGDILGRIAEGGKGTTARGNPDTIGEVFRDMGAFF